MDDRCKRYHGARAVAHTTDFIGICGQSTQWENAIHVANPAKSQPRWLDLGDLGKMIRRPNEVPPEQTIMPSPIASAILDSEFLELRAGLLQAASHLDRLDRASGSVADDPRMRGVRQAIEALSKSGPSRAEQIQLIFSRPYEEDWKRKLEIGTR